jgi:cell division protein FtsL
MEKIICPVCETPLSLDYKVNQVICHQCDSDLKAYMLINEIAQKEITTSLKVVNANKKFHKAVILGSIICVLVLIISTILISEQSGKNAEQTKNLEIKINQLETENKQLSLSTEELKRRITEKSINSNTGFIVRIIKTGDSFSKLAYLYYGSGNNKKALIIAEYNSLKISSMLIPGDTIKIKINPVQ